mmetsp:Transcript_30730/g.55745  ORF Transcript_30730/g.55745 Transcript_30730/m.55745 type:complete len:664 (+) Transcript_30730:44-2035(+)|eukprot:CAMPEP_0197655232 /NCGR_PEP_ID=MMETSP1338-20131121/39331_1 /TAXON_ID=43686 ORGANISM="Pelagodinium beii, Strain RCC1491" /NCGR_SAMPLE_ID=MMETSP1338 /ASSEMBLY_ACC=CAM_ASM_000754 /LENGTH=663 /DNA_ID=CAMNT_0043230841 /DNA_START=44 /DNA_END=2035 /DNA_ORIENTATION=+
MKAATAILAVLLARAASLKLDLDEKVRPVTKVVGLLMGMQKQLEKEAADEAELMEKFRCWCKENSQNSREEILANIKNMENRIAELSANSARLEVEYKNLQEEVDEGETSMDESMALRKKDVAKFLAEDAELSKQLNAVKSARASVDVAPGQGAFLQQGSADRVAVNTIFESVLAREDSHLSDEKRDEVSSLLQEPNVATGQIDGILDTIQLDIEANLKDIRDQEKEGKIAYEELMKSKRKEIDAGKISIASKKEQKTAGDEERVHLKQDVKDAKATMEADIAFSKEVKDKCFKKEKDYEVRSNTREDETLAVAKAIQVLNSDDAQANFGKTLSFIQVSSVSAEQQTQRNLAWKTLVEMGKKQDKRLVTLSMEAKLDGFGRVKEKINLMVDALKKEGDNEAKKKEYCLKEFHENRMDTEDKQRDLNDLDAKKEQFSQQLEEAKAEIATMQKETEEIKKQQKLASQNREKENTEFQAVVAEQRQTQTLLKKALGILSGFYTKKHPSLLQSFKPAAGEQREKAPETFSGSYKESKNSNGVLLMLQQLIADAVEMEKESTFGERESQEDYETFAKDMQAELEDTEKEMMDKADEKAKLEGKLSETKQSTKGANNELDELKDTNVELHETCDYTLERFDARYKAREDEIAALKQAKTYLSGATLVQN